jgi:polysaccharide deacetylase 2 family uncharacterized protein YibQ
LIARTLLFTTWGVLGAAGATAVAVASWLGPKPAPLPVPRQVAATVERPAAKGRVAVAGTISEPDPALLAAMPGAPGRMLPVIGADGRRPSEVYAAAPVAVLPDQARLALVVDGIGLDGAASRAAIAELPPPVDFAFSPYGSDADTLAEAARRRGHEMLVSIPMEPQGSPANDEGARQLSPSSDASANSANLSWSLSSLRGYVGATAAEAGQNGEHVLDDPDSLAPVSAELRSRGLLFVDPRPGSTAPPGMVAVSADVTIDGLDEPDAQSAALEALVGVATRSGRALGMIGPLSPAGLERLMAWTRTLPAKGIILVPASSLANEPKPSDRTASVGP